MGERNMLPAGRKRKFQSRYHDVVEGQIRDQQLLVLVKQIADQLDFELFDGEDHWALVPNDKTEPSAVGDLHFIARCLERLSKQDA